MKPAAAPSATGTTLDKTRKTITDAIADANDTAARLEVEMAVAEAAAAEMETIDVEVAMVAQPVPQVTPAYVGPDQLTSTVCPALCPTRDDAPLMRTWC